MNKIKFVIVGVGNIGSKYVSLIEELSDSEIIAVVDSNFGRRKFVNKLVPFFTSLEDFFTARIQADVICICTPNGLHPSQTIDCLKAGYHVICEKPVALKADDVLKMMDAEKISGKKVFAVMQNRYSPVAIWLKKLMALELVGEIRLLQINCFWNRNNKYYQDSPWRATKKLGGGPLYSQFSHFIDLMIWICGNPKNIRSEFFTLNKEIHTQFKDSGIINFNLGTNGKGVFNFTNAAYETNIESSLTIIGSKGNVKVGGQYMEKLDFVNLDQVFEIPVFENVTKANSYTYYQGSADKHDVFLKRVIHCIKNNHEPEIGLTDELNVIHFIEQAVLYAEAKSY